MSSYPVSFAVARPVRFERFHVVVRLVVVTLLSLFGLSSGWPFLLLMLALPAYAAVQSSAKGGQRYLAEDGPRVAAVIRWLLAAYAWLGLLTDELPDDRYAEHIAFDVAPRGSPSPGAALWRLITCIPGLVFLFVVGIAGGIVWVVSMVLVALTGMYPEPLYELQAGILRFTGRLLAWQASLVDEYPPFALREVPTPHGEDLAHHGPA
jgi:Domain of unknown function (DUF4389)